MAMRAVGLPPDPELAVSRVWGMVSTHQHAPLQCTLNSLVEAFLPERLACGVADPWLHVAMTQCCVALTVLELHRAVMSVRLPKWARRILITCDRPTQQAIADLDPGYL